MLIALVPLDSHAFIDLGQGDWLSGQNALFVQLLATELDSLANITQMLAQVKDIVSTGNDVLSTARAAYREYRALRNFTREDLYNSAMRGLMRAFPDLAAINKEILDMKGSFKADDFWSYYGLHDQRITKDMQQWTEFSLQQYVWPKIFPNATKLLKNPNPVDVTIWEQYKKSGMSSLVVAQTSAMSTLNEKANRFVEDAEEIGNLELAIGAAQNQATTQLLVNSNEMLNLMKMQMAQETQARNIEIERRKILVQTMKTEDLLGPGAMWKEGE
jgi:hypothetical protein